MVRHRLTGTVAADADWYGRSTAAGSLMVWTHNRKEMVWHDAYTPAECSGGGDEAVPAVSVESGVQFFDLCECLVNAYPLAWVELPDDWVLFERAPLLSLSLSPLSVYPRVVDRGKGVRERTTKGVCGATRTSQRLMSNARGFGTDPAAQNRKRLVIGGTCDSVGVAGCWLSGCYGVFSKKFGAGALNMLSARVVLANGSLVVANKCSHPDLFWSLRGGGGGVAGVVTEFTVRSHPSPRWMTGATFAGNVSTRADYVRLLREGLKVLAAVAEDADQAPNGGLGFGTANEIGLDGRVRTVYVMSILIQGFESNTTTQNAYLQPLLDFVFKSGEVRGWGRIENTRWDESQWDPKNPALPWYGYSAGDKAAATVSMMTRFIPLSYIGTERGQILLAEAWAKVTDELPTPTTVGVMIPKAQGGLPIHLRPTFHETALNPVILDAAGTLLQFTQLPWFEELPQTTHVLKAIWPRLSTSVELFTDNCTGSNASAVTRQCDAGANGDAAAAQACLGDWQDRLVPAFQRRADKVRVTLRDALPNVNASGLPFSGAYWSETDYFEKDFELSYWGAKKYTRLLEIKTRYDPRGLFICRHCVGSEYWTEESHLNCRNTSRVPPSL